MRFGLNRTSLRLGEASGAALALPLIGLAARLHAEMRRFDEARVDQTKSGDPNSTVTPASLCHSCTFVREVKGRRDQTYLLCQNDTIEAKYPRQPVLTCLGYLALSGGPRPPHASREG